MVTLPGANFEPTYMLLAVALFSLRAIVYGLSIGGAALAWNLGHLHFAPPQQAEVYMGIHVSLTGVRGLVALLAGMWLWNKIGWPVWLIAIALSLSSLGMYAVMARRERLEQRLDGPDAQT